MKLKIIVSEMVPPGKMYVLDPDAGGALADAVRTQLDLGEPDGVALRVFVVKTERLQEKLRGFAVAVGVDVIE